MARKEKGAVVVTGASSGIGRATALRLDELGYTVFPGVRKDKDAKSLSEAGSERITPITLEVTKARSISAARQKVQRAVGKDGLVGLVNNAGIANAGPIEHLPVAEFEKVIDVNLTGQYAVTQEFLPLIRRATGTIVFITSIGGLIATPFMSPYHAAKFGLEGVADSLRREVKPWGINVVVVEPGSIATPIWGKGSDAFDGIKFPPRGEAPVWQADRSDEKGPHRHGRSRDPAQEGRERDLQGDREEPAEDPLPGRDRREDDEASEGRRRRPQLRQADAALDETARRRAESSLTTHSGCTVGGVRVALRVALLIVASLGLSAAHASAAGTLVSQTMGGIATPVAQDASTPGPWLPHPEHGLDL